MFSQFRRNVFDPLHMMKSKSPRRKYWQVLEETQFHDHKDLLAIQNDRFMTLWHKLWEISPYYEKRFVDAGLSPRAVKSVEDIAKLPVLYKHEIRNDAERLLSQGYTKEALLHYSTGGSTGKALDLYITEECSELRNACTRRHDRWTGWEIGDAIGAVWGNPKLPKTIKEKLMHHLLQPYIYLDTMALSDQSVLNFVEHWDATKPSLLYGHAHSLFILAKYLQKLACYRIQPKGILSTSMMLVDHERTLIEDVFSCKVTDRYGCEEVSLIGSECEKHEGLHMNIEHLVIEFLNEDGDPVQPGEHGNIVVTDLMNEAMPFIRYRVEDVGFPLERMCSCGRGLPLMGSVTGRTADFLVKHDGNRVAGVSLIENTLTKLPGIDQMQIVQEAVDSIHLRVVPGNDFNQIISADLTKYFEEVFPQTTVTLEEVSEILPESSGKYRFSICKVPNES